jgi:hypothetical protein
MRCSCRVHRYWQHRTNRHRAGLGGEGGEASALRRSFRNHQCPLVAACGLSVVRKTAAPCAECRAFPTWWGPGRCCDEGYSTAVQSATAPNYAGWRPANTPSLFAEPTVPAQSTLARVSQLPVLQCIQGAASKSRLSGLVQQSSDQVATLAASAPDYTWQRPADTFSTVSKPSFHPEEARVLGSLLPASP